MPEGRESKYISRFRGEFVGRELGGGGGRGSEGAGELRRSEGEV